jgi:hypothetical protein
VPLVDLVCDLDEALVESIQGVRPLLVGVMHQHPNLTRVSAQMTPVDLATGSLGSIPDRCPLPEAVDDVLRCLLAAEPHVVFAGFTFDLEEKGHLST